MKSLSTDELRARIVATAINPMTYREICCAIGMRPGMKRLLKTLLDAGEVRRYGVRNTFDMGCEELFISAPHSLVVNPYRCALANSIPYD